MNILKFIHVTKVRDYSVDLENALKACQATGEGIKERVLSIQDKLPTDIQNKIQRCNHLRNRVMHDKYNPTIDEYQQYKKDMHKVLDFLQRLASAKERNDEVNEDVITILVLIVFASIGFLSISFGCRF